jgi:hypothetical protein
VLAADGIFVAGELVAPLPTPSLRMLQNGPDSIRLVDATGGVLDVVGCGGHRRSAFVEGLGARPCPGNRSHARSTGRFDDNSVDFVAARPLGPYNVARGPRHCLAPRRRTRPTGTSIAVLLENRGLVSGAQEFRRAHDSTAVGVSQSIVA